MVNGAHRVNRSINFSSPAMIKIRENLDRKFMRFNKKYGGNWHGHDPRYRFNDIEVYARSDHKQPWLLAIYGRPHTTCRVKTILSKRWLDRTMVKVSRVRLASYFSLAKLRSMKEFEGNEIWCWNLFNLSRLLNSTFRAGVLDWYTPNRASGNFFNRSILIV